MKLCMKLCFLVVLSYRCCFLQNRNIWRDILRTRWSTGRVSVCSSEGIGHCGHQRLPLWGHWARGGHSSGNGCRKCNLNVWATDSHVCIKNLESTFSHGQCVEQACCQRKSQNCCLCSVMQKHPSDTVAGQNPQWLEIHFLCALPAQHLSENCVFVYKIIVFCRYLLSAWQQQWAAPCRRERSWASSPVEAQMWFCCCRLQPNQYKNIMGMGRAFCMGPRLLSVASEIKSTQSCNWTMLYQILRCFRCPLMLEK